MKKQKFKSAEHAKKAREAEKYQQELYKKWGISEAKKTPSKKTFVPDYTHRSSDNKIGSVALSGGVCGKKDSPKYTGDLIKGVAVMHKSCLQPVISKEQATESARMRR